MEKMDEKLLENVNGGREIFEAELASDDPMEAGRCPVCTSMLVKKTGILGVRYYCPVCKEYVKKN